MITAQQVHGLWRLVSFIEQRPDGSWYDYLGADAPGYISYWPSGHMQVMIGALDRPRFRGAWNAIADADKALCLGKMVAYAGTWSLRDGRVFHRTEVCWIPNWEGRDLIRKVSFPAPDRLLLTTEPDPEGRRAMQEVLWQRVR